MSADFMLTYAGKAVRIANGVPFLVEEDEADRFTCEADAWYAAFKSNFNPAHTKVVNLHARNCQKISGLIHNAPATCAGHGVAGLVDCTVSRVSAAPGDGKVRTGHSLPS